MREREDMTGIAATRPAAPGPRGHARLRHALLLGTALGAAFATPQMAQADPVANARPQGGTISAGQASIARGTTSTTITQSSNRAVIDWTGFDVGANQSVTFVQPGSGATTLNRVNAAEPSQIAGSISANGRIIIENRAGIIVADGARIDATGVVLSAAGITNHEFMSGGSRFTTPARAGASVSNSGTITVKQAGLAALVAPNVSNDGVIEARGGAVVLGGATTYKLDLYGDGLLSFETTPPGQSASVRNTGTIAANGGRVLLSAAQADAVVTGVVEAGGRISADTTGRGAGSIVIRATGGSITIDGALTAAGRAAGQAGGSIAVTTPGTIAVATGATLDTSGRSGGGSIALGAQGKTIAASTSIAAGALLRADATERGRGGHITLMSSQTTAMAGSISAQGGPRGGDGGSVDVSGHLGFALTGPITVAAAAGTPGTILIDPQDLTIQTGGTNGALFQPGGGGGTLAASNNGGSSSAISAVVDPSVFAGLSGNVVLQASRDLTVQSAITSAASSLTLQAGRNLTVNAPISLSGTGTLAIAAAVTRFAGLPGYDPAGPAGALTIAATGGISAPQAQVNLAAGTGGIAIGSAITAGALSLTTTGAITQTAPISTARLDLSAASATLTASTNAMTVLGTVVTAGNLSLSSTTDIALLGTLQAGSPSAPNVANTATLQITTPGAFTIGSTAVRSTINAGNVTLLAGGTISEPNGAIAANTLSGPQAGAAITTAAAVSLRGQNTVTTLGGFTALGDFAFVNSTSLLVVGAITAGTLPAPNPANTSTLDLIAAGDLVLGGTQFGALNGGRVDLEASGAISETRGIIQANTLTGPSSGALFTSARSASLTGSNIFTVLGSFTTSGNLQITDTTGLQVNGIVSAGNGGGNTSGNTASATFTVAGDLRVGQVGAPSVISAGTVALLASGTIAEISGGIVANLLTGPGPGTSVAQAIEADLHATNIVNQIGRFYTSGNFAISDVTSVTVIGTLQAGAAATSAITSTGGLTIGQGAVPAVISAGTVSLLAAGEINEAPASSINATLLTGPFAGLSTNAAGDATLNGSNNVAQISQFSVTGSLIFRDQTNLTVVGTLLAGTALAPDSRNSGAIGLIVTGNLALGTAAVPALLNAGTVGLAATGTITEPYGSIAANQLNDLRLPGTPPIASLITLTGSNTLTAIGEFGARGNITVADSIPLTVLGTITAGGVQAPAATNTATINLQVNGGLAIGAAGQPGGLNAGTVVLMPTGAITEPNGAITTNLLTLPAAGQLVAQAPAIALGGGNAIATLGPIAALGDVTINSTVAMTAGGAITLGTGAPGAGNTTTLTLSSASDLTLGATMTAGTLALLAAGTLSQPGGILVASLLEGPAPGLTQPSAAAITLQAANSLAAIGDITASGPIAITDTLPISVTGSVQAGGAASLTLGSGSGISIGSASQAALLSAGTVTLLTGGTIAEGALGRIVAGTLTGPNSAASVPAAAAITLPGSNSIGTLASLAAVGDILLANTTALTVAGTLSAGPIGGPGTSNTAHLTIGLSGGALALGATATPGVLSAGTIAIAAAGGISEPNGRLSAAFLTDQTGIAGVPHSASVSLPSLTNSVATLGTISSTSGNLVLASSGPMTVIGPVNSSQYLEIDTTGAMTIIGNMSSGPTGALLSGDLGVQQVSGGITASATGASQLSIVSARGGFVQLPGASITTATSASITTAGSIGIGASIIAPQGTLTLNSSGGAIVESGAGGNKGTVYVQALNASAASGVILDSASNRISTLTGASSGGRFVLDTTFALTITGNVTTAADVSIAGTKTVEQVAGSIVAGGSGVVMLAQLGALTQDRGAYIGATGDSGTVSLTASSAGATIDLGGTVAAQGSAAAVVLNAPVGAITARDQLVQGGTTLPAGRILATQLSATAQQNIVLDPVGAANAVGAVASLVSSGGTLGLADLTSLRVNGPVQAANNLRLAAGGDLSLASGAAVHSTNGLAALQAGGTLAIPATSTVTAPSVALSAPLDVAIGGTISGGKLVIGGLNGGAAGLVALGDGASLLTGDAGAPSGTAPLTAWPSAAGATAGGFITAQNLTIGWASTVSGANGSATQSLRIDLTGAGVIEPSVGLIAGTTTLLLNLGSHAHISGNVTLGGLAIAYARGAGGNADLTGTVRGVGGEAAAQISTITPGPSALYQLNACPVASVACFVVSTEQLPPTIPIRDLDIRPAHDTVDDAEVLLPNVSRDDL